jgi:hypothetical protein
LNVGPCAGSSIADGQLWESRNRGDSWTQLQIRGGAVGALGAVAFAERSSL